jgi:hypothetical protein
LKVETDCSSQKQRENGFEEREGEREIKRESLTFHTNSSSPYATKTDKERERERERV